MTQNVTPKWTAINKTVLPSGFAEDRTFVLIESLILLAICISNASLIIMLIKSKNTRTNKNDYYGYYLLHLFSVNLFTALLIIPGSFLQMSGWITETVCSRLISFLHVFGTTLCVGSITMMILERHLVTIKHCRRRTLWRKVKQKLMFIWVWAITTALPRISPNSNRTLFDWNMNEDYNNNSIYAKIYSLFLFVSIVFVPTVVILFCCYKITSSYSTESAVLIKRKKRYRKFTKMVVLLLTVFSIGCTPSFLLELVINFHRDVRNSPQLVSTILSMFCSTYFLYPCLFFVMYRKVLNRKKDESPKMLVLRRSFYDIYENIPRKSSVKNLFPNRRLSMHRKSCDDEIANFITQCYGESCVESELTDTKIKERLSLDFTFKKEFNMFSRLQRRLSSYTESRQVQYSINNNLLPSYRE